MAFDSDVNPNAGSDFGDFLINKLLPFLRDNMGWVDNQVPTRSPDVSLGNPTSELWTHRGGAAQRPAGSPNAGSPLVVSPEAQPPFLFWKSSEGDYGVLCTGHGGTDASEEYFDQPNNPATGPFSNDTNANLKASAQRMEFQIQPALDGPYSAYWLFGPGDGRYIHIVLKVAARHYRHFWIGMLDRFSTDISDQTFYVCGHHWESIDPDAVSISLSGTFLEAAPYESEQMPPGAPGSTSQALDSPKDQHRSALYCPGLTSESPTVDWYYSSDDGAGARAIAGPATKSVNANISIRSCAFTSYGGMFGHALWRCDESFTANVKPLVPILTFVNVPFGGDEKWAALGKVPDVFRINMNGLSAEDEIVVGSDTYVVFPVTNSDSANRLSGEPYSGFEGYAYKKILGSP